MDQASLRILHIVCASRWAAGNPPQSALIDALHTQPGLDNRIVLLADDAALCSVDNDRVMVIDQREGTLVQRWKTLPALVAQRPDVVHAHGCAEGPLCMWVTLRARSTPLHSMHNRIRSNRGGALHRAADILWNCTHVNVVCDSHALAARLIPRARSHVSVIEPGIDVQALDTQAACAAPLDFADDSFQVAFVGPLCDEMRLDMALATTWLLAQDRPGRFRLHVFGQGETRPHCEAFVQRHDLDASVIFHGHTPVLAPWLARMDALLWCGETQASPAGVLEAMMLGVPVVAHATHDMARLLGFGAYGTLVHEHAPHAYADSLVALEAHPGRARERATVTREYARGHYDISRVAQRYATLYHTLHAARRSPAPGVCYIQDATAGRPSSALHPSGRLR